ncbi:hypothetical protein [Mitsuaria sp. 7]|uniref:hypothetical protein n=1 Tax=Mitsuaria sp. 7 TaxID=1658665 RepID=UPI0012F969FE|nr:hypothetical protein [Mitsuaria sp. 7]
MLVTLIEFERNSGAYSDAGLQAWDAVALTVSEALFAVRFQSMKEGSQVRTLLVSPPAFTETLRKILPGRVLRLDLLNLGVDGQRSMHTVQELWLPFAFERRAGLLMRIQGLTTLVDESLRPIPEGEGRTLVWSTSSRDRVHEPSCSQQHERALSSSW